MSAGIDSAAMQRGLGGGETGIREYRDATPGRNGREGEADASEGRHICSGRGPGDLEDQGDGVVGGMARLPGLRGFAERGVKREGGCNVLGQTFLSLFRGRNSLVARLARAKRDASLQTGRLPTWKTH